MMIRTKSGVAAVALAVIASVATRASAHDEAAVLAMATRTLEDMSANPNTGVPVNLLRKSEGVIVVPNMINASFIFGAKVGRGVFLVRDSKGKWGNPIFVHVSGGSFGLQAGAQATELLMVFRAKDTVTRLLAGKGKITLGVDAGVAAGPVGTGVGADTDLGMRAEILTYARSRGLFAGASLGGSGISVDRRNDAIYYGDFNATTFQIIEGDGVGVPIEAAKLKGILTLLTNPLPQGTVEVIEEGAPVVRPRRRPTVEDNDPAPMPHRRPPAGDDEPAGNDRLEPLPTRPGRRSDLPEAAPPVIESTPKPRPNVPIEGPSTGNDPR